MIFGREKALELKVADLMHKHGFQKDEYLLVFGEGFEFSCGCCNKPDSYYLVCDLNCELIKDKSSWFYKNISKNIEKDLLNGADFRWITIVEAKQNHLVWEW